MVLCTPKGRILSTRDAADFQGEKGSPSVSMGAYVQVLLAIGMADDILLIAKDDILGRKLQDLALPVGKRASKR